MDVPETRYATTVDGAHIAFQVVGDGPVDILFRPEVGSHIELAWDMPGYAHVLRRLSSFGRLIQFSSRGSGLSDPLSLSERPTLEEQAKEMLAVLDATASERAAVVANNAGGLLAIFFAATYPNRTSTLVLDGCYARRVWAPDYPFGEPAESLQRTLASTGDPERRHLAVITPLAPHAAKDPEFVAQWRRYNGSVRSPAAARAMGEMVTFADVRPVLPSIQAPTLVLYRHGDQFAGKPYATYLAEHIPGAKLVELPGDENFIIVGDSDADLDEIEEFLTGTRHAVATDRVLATVVFTDIVGSTQRAAELGDRRWRELLDAHDRLVRRQLERFRGREVNTVGDGFVATFDGPGRAIECACAIRDAVQALGIEVRAGLHTGEIEVRGSDIAGMAVHIGARVAASAEPSEVLVSGAVPPLVVGSGIEFNDRGEHELKGVPGSWHLYSVIA